jgi:hypothetical protein
MYCELGTHSLVGKFFKRYFDGSILGYQEEVRFRRSFLINE